MKEPYTLKSDWGLTQWLRPDDKCSECKEVLKNSNILEMPHSIEWQSVKNDKIVKNRVCYCLLHLASSL